MRACSEDYVKVFHFLWLILLVYFVEDNGPEIQKSADTAGLQKSTLFTIALISFSHMESIHRTFS